jgi:hypothetical protein
VDGAGAAEAGAAGKLDAIETQLRRLFSDGDGGAPTATAAAPPPDAAAIALADTIRRTPVGTSNLVGSRPELWLLVPSLWASTFY